MPDEMFHNCAVVLWCSYADSDVSHLMEVVFEDGAVCEVEINNLIKNMLCAVTDQGNHFCDLPQDSGFLCEMLLLF